MTEAVTSTSSLAPEETRSNADAWASIAESIAGRARWLYEMATGRSLITTEQARCGKNPSGHVGADLSGPPYGSAIRHTVTHGTVMRSVDGWRRSPTTRRNFSLTQPRVLRFAPWVMPYHVHAGAPHGQLRLFVVVNRLSASGTGTVSISATYKGATRTASDTIAGVGVAEITLEVPGFTPTAYADASTPLVVTVAADDTADYVLSRVGLWQTRKRDT